MQGGLPPDAQEKIEQLQDLQETAQQVAVQKNEAETELTEAKNALGELEDIDEDATMYQTVGDLLIETEYDEARDDLEEKVDSLEIRVETLEKQENRVREQFEELQDELQELLGGAGGGMGGMPGGGGPGAGGD